MSAVSRGYKTVLTALRRATGYDFRMWTRIVMDETCLDHLRSLNPETLDVLEISGGQPWKELNFKSFTEVAYPEFDICTDRLDSRFDLVIADQVFEHVVDPSAAARNVHAMLNPHGIFMITTPFMIKVHEVPLDCRRWTETGMKQMLAAAGFPEDGISTGSWGNRAVIRQMLRRPDKWPRRGWGSLRNEPAFPVVVWAFARRAG